MLVLPEARERDANSADGGMHPVDVPAREPEGIRGKRGTGLRSALPAKRGWRPSIGVRPVPLPGTVTPQTSYDRGAECARPPETDASSFTGEGAPMPLPEEFDRFLEKAIAKVRTEWGAGGIAVSPDSSGMSASPGLCSL